jgi:ribosome biogenesis GTPase
MHIETLGWSEPFIHAFEDVQLEFAGAMPARVVAAQRERYRLFCAAGALDAQLSGRLRHEAGEGALPVVGDWVGALLRPDDASATIVACLPRRTSLVRKRAGRASLPQVLAANLDTVLLMSSLNDDLNPRRVERTLAMIWESGAQPVVLLSKLDLCADPAPFVAEIEQVAIGVPVHALSVHTGDGLAVLARYLQPGRTLALIGSSGVGKSTLANALLGEQRLATSDVRASDQRGKHTTTARELFVLRSGAMLIDTPGMRELGLWDAGDGFSAAFDDIEALAAHCRFGDCKHEREPGCAISEALARGELDPARLASYRKLQRELAHEERRRDPQAMAAYKQHNRQILRARARANRSRPKR